MSQFKENERARFVKEMFGAISGSYDRVNRLITFGQDHKWRKYVIREAALSAEHLLLDVGTGTGGIALEAKKNIPGVKVVGADFSPAMISRGRKRSGGHTVLWCVSDALCLPFPDKSFEAVTSGFLVRNVTDILQAIKEQVRVVKPGGRVVCLETSPPPSNILTPLVKLHFKFIIPWLGQLIAGNRSAYQYLPATTQAFLPPDQLAAVMEKAGLKNVRFKQFMWGSMAIHTGIRP